MSTTFGWLSLRSRPVSYGNLTLWCHTNVTELDGVGAVGEMFPVSLLADGVLVPGGGVLDDPLDPPLVAATPMIAAMITAAAPISAAVIWVLCEVLGFSLDMTRLPRSRAELTTVRYQTG